MWCAGRDQAYTSLAIRWDLPDHGASYRTTVHNSVLTYVKDSDKPVSLTLTVPAAALIALAQGNIDAGRGNRLVTSGDESQLASLFSVLQPGNPTSPSSNPDQPPGQRALKLARSLTAAHLPRSIL